MATDLIVPLKRPTAGKSRLRGALDGPPDSERHAELVLALALDTLSAAVEATGVRRVLVVGTDPVALDALRQTGAEVTGEDGDHGLNGALRTGERLLRRDDPHGTVGALQADLPALRPEDLSAALAEAASGRAFAADRHGTGTTLLVSTPGGPLDPRFGPDSARAHIRSGARPLRLAAPSLRGDADTPADLEYLRPLGLGRHTAALLNPSFLPR